MSGVNVISNVTLNFQQEEVLERFKEFLKAMIEKDEKKLNEIIDDNYTLTHMYGKTQTKEEFIDDIMKGILNYYNSTIIEPEITIINDNLTRIIADVELEAKVYGIKGTWTLNTDLSMKKMDNEWLLNVWKN